MSRSRRLEEGANGPDREVPADRPRRSAELDGVSPIRRRTDGRPTAHEVVLGSGVASVGQSVHFKDTPEVTILTRDSSECTETSDRAGSRRDESSTAVILAKVVDQLYEISVRMDRQKETKSLLEETRGSMLRRTKRDDVTLNVSPRANSTACASCREKSRSEQATGDIINEWETHEKG